MKFGDENVFAIDCVKTSFGGDAVAGIALHLNGKCIGDSLDTCPVGAILHSAAVFLKYTGERQVSIGATHPVYEHLCDSIYGDSWRVGVSHQYGAKFAVHEVFDISVGDKGWVVFLVDTDAQNSRLMLGTRQDGYLSDSVVPRGYVESVVSSMTSWLGQS